MYERKKTVLLMEASSRQVLPMARAFVNLGYEVITVCEHKYDLGAVTRFKKNALIVPGVDSDIDLANRVYDEIVKKNKYDIVVPLSDFSAEIAARNKIKWESYGVNVAVNNWDAFILAYDKLNTMRICMKNDIPCPFTLLVEREEDIDFASIKYPVVVKPRSACGSIGFHKVDSEELLRKLLRDDSHGPMLIQEFIPQTGKQYNAHFFLDNNHEMQMAVCTQKCRWFPIDGGASSLCRTIKNDYIIDICIKLLKEIGWVGYCDIDLMEDPRDGSIRIIEINARISANVKICYVVGADIAQQISAQVEKKPLHIYINNKEDYRLRCIHTDLLWFLKSGKRFETEPSWFSFKNTTDQIFSIDDILPFVCFSVSAVLKYKKEMKKRER